MRWPRMARYGSTLPSRGTDVNQAQHAMRRVNLFRASSASEGNSLLHNAIKGTGIGVICLAVFLSITSIRHASPPPEEVISPNANDKNASGSAPLIADSNHRQIPEHGSTALEQAILDSFAGNSHTPPDAKKHWEGAESYLSGAINVKGHLCAVPVEARRASADMWGIGCITNRDGWGKSNYLVYILTGEVTRI